MKNKNKHEKIPVFSTKDRDEAIREYNRLSELYPSDRVIVSVYREDQLIVHPGLHCDIRPLRQYTRGTLTELKSYLIDRLMPLPSEYATGKIEDLLPEVFLRFSGIK